MSVFISLIFIQSLFFKFTDASETQHIFNTLNDWANDRFGIDGLFIAPGPFNAYVIGSAELIASIILLMGGIFKKPVFTLIGSLMALCIMSGAVFFHLFTPLGIDVQNDGGALFLMACLIWVFSLIQLFLYRDVICHYFNKVD